jgi:hypothetical protein
MPFTAEKDLRAVKSKLKWRLKEIGFDPEMHAQILGLLHANQIERPEIGLTHTELNALSTQRYLTHYPEDEECIIEMFERDECEGTYAKLIRNAALREHYKDCGGMVDGEWRWYAKAPEPQPVKPVSPRVAEILAALSNVKTVHEIEAETKAREADPVWREAVRQRRIAEGYEGYIKPGTE